MRTWVNRRRSHVREARKSNEFKSLPWYRMNGAATQNPPLALSLMLSGVPGKFSANTSARPALIPLMLYLKTNNHNCYNYYYNSIYSIQFGNNRIEHHYNYSLFVSNVSIFLGYAVRKR